MRDYYETGTKPPQPVGERIQTESHTLHIFEQGDLGFMVWLNTEVADFDGLCIGGGLTRDKAVASAVKALEEAAEVLQRPPAGKVCWMCDGGGVTRNRGLQQCHVCSGTGRLG